MATVTDSFQQELNQVINDLISAHIVPAVTRFLAIKYQFQLNPDELTAEAFQSPSARVSRPASRAASTSFALPPKAATNTTASTGDAPYGRCQVTISSGQDSGKVCNRELKPGAVACGIHSRGKKDGPPGKPAGKAKATNVSPANNFPVAQTNYPINPGSIYLRPGGNGLSAIEGVPNLHNVIVESLPDNTIVAVHWADPAGNLLPLTDAHKQALTAHGITFKTTVPGAGSGVPAPATSGVRPPSYPATANVMAMNAVPPPQFAAKPTFPGFNPSGLTPGGGFNPVGKITVPSFPAEVGLPANALTDGDEGEEPSEFEGEERD